MYQLVIWGIKMDEQYNALYPDFKQRLKNAAEQGLLLFVKYSLLVLLVFGALQYFNTLVQGSQNGTQSALYLQQAIEKGYLPKPGPNGLEPKVEAPVVSKD